MEPVGTTEPRTLTPKEVLVMDSSTFIEEAGLTSRGASALKHYLHHRGTQLVVPQAVAEECERKLTQRAIGKKKQVEDSLEWLARFFGSVSGWSAPSDDAFEVRAKSLAKACHLNAIVVPETEAVRARAESRKDAERPPSHRRRGLGDCRIWEQCLELLKDHDVIFVAKDEDFRSHANHEELHPQLQAEAKAVGSGRCLTFHRRMESLLCELRREIPSIPKEEVFTFVYEAAATNIEELESNSGYRPKGTGEVTQTFLTTDEADVIEIRLEVTDEWEHPEDGEVADFLLRGSCRYSLTKQQLSDLKLSNIRLPVKQADGSVRAAEGSAVYVGGTIHVGGPPPIQPEPEILG